jgi:hypothetical protein
MSDENPTERFPASTTTPPDAESPLTRNADFPRRSRISTGKGDPPARRLIVILAVVGGVLLLVVIALLVLLLVRSPVPTAAPVPTTTSSSPAPSPSPSVTSPSPSPSPSASTPADVSAGAAITSFTVNQTTISCPTDTGQPSPTLAFSWTSTNAAEAFFGVDTLDASVSPFYSQLPPNGDSTDFPNSPLDYACPAANHTYTITLMGNGTTVSRTLTVTNNGFTG